MLNGLFFSNRHTQSAERQAAPVRPWGPAAAFLIVLLTYVSQYLASLLAVGYVLLAGKTRALAPDGTPTPATWFVVVLLVEIVAVGLLYLFLRARRMDFWQSVGIRLRDFRPRYLGYAGLGFLGYVVVAFVLLSAAQYLPFLDPGQKQAIGFDTANIHAGGLAFAFLALVILPPIAEEMIFRGFLLGTLRRRWGLLRAALATSVLFGLLHLLTGENGLLWIGALDTFILSTVLCYARGKTGNIWTSIIIHSLKNCMAFMLLFKLALF